MATHRPQPPPGARPLIPSPWARLTWSDGDAFNFPSWWVEDPAVWAQSEEWQAFPTRAGCSQPTSQPASPPPPASPLSLPLHPKLTQGGTSLWNLRMGKKRSRRGQSSAIPGVGHSPVLEGGHSCSSSAEAMMAFSRE